MKNSLAEIVKGLEIKEAQIVIDAKEPDVKQDKNGRRNFFKKAAIGGVALGGFMFSSLEDTIAHRSNRRVKEEKKGLNK